MERFILDQILVLKEEDEDKMWATDSSGKSIPIDITNGSKLLISGGCWTINR